MLYLILFSLIANVASANDMVAVVNKAPITSYEVSKVKRLATLFNPHDGSSQMEKKLNSHALNTLITQRLIGDNKKFESLKASGSDIDEAIEEIEKQFKLTKGYLRDITYEKGVYDFFKNKVEFDILVDNITKQALMPNIQVFNDEVEDLVVIGGGAKVNTDLLVFTSKGLDEKSYKQMRSLRNKLFKAKGELKAKIYESFATKDEFKGDVEKVSSSFQAAARSLKPKDITNVLKTPEGFKIVVMRERDIKDLSKEDKAALINAIASNKMNVAMKKLDTQIQEKAYIKVF